MKSFLLIAVVCFTAVLAFEEINQDDHLTGLISEETLEDAVKYDVDDETLSLIPDLITGRPLCIVNRDHFYPHVSPFRYWACAGFLQAESRRCEPLRLFAESAQRCVWAWNWRPDGHIESWCARPSCDGLLRHFLQPHSSADHYWQCAPYGVVARPCAPGTKFNFRSQRCDWPSTWRNLC